MIGLLGGSFDPIHHGHLLVGQAAVEQLGLEELRFMPAGEQPFKRGRHAVAAERRAEMVALAIAGEPRFRLERAEVERPGPSYTVDTLRALRAREPGAEFAVLVGADAAAELPLWHEAAELPRLARIVVFERAGEAAPASPMVTGRIAVPALELSATAIRARVAAGLSIRYWVPDAVADYVAAHGLYRNGAG
ncbi:MAG TPA: nicotinate-nucleotide adenylyltransferase [Gemmatimonadales bacterium]|nr:nicotinate-nucleotide adenylyltransferase [Gemmatimonadales bacterium]